VQPIEYDIKTTHSIKSLGFSDAKVGYRRKEFKFELPAINKQETTTTQREEKHL
jgi:hypothetical protein